MADKKQPKQSKPQQQGSGNKRKAYYTAQRGRTDDNKRRRLERQIRRFPEDSQAQRLFAERYRGVLPAPTIAARTRRAYWSQISKLRDAHAKADAARERPTLFDLDAARASAKAARQRLRAALS